MSSKGAHAMADDSIKQPTVEESADAAAPRKRRGLFGGGSGKKKVSTKGANKPSGSASGGKRKKPQTSLAYDLTVLLVKIGVIVVAFVVLFTFVFGLFRVSDAYMEPSMKDGDLILYYRLDKRVVASEVVAVEYQGKISAARVIATGGDVVNIDSEGLLVNGAYQQEQGITDETTQVADGVTFPLTVPEGSVFLLGDNRDQAVDSRIYGCIPIEELNGKVMGQFRRRGF